MLTAHEILDAVKKGGISNWSPACEKNQKATQTIAHKEFHSELQNRLDEFMTALGNNQLSTAQLAQKLGWKVETTRSRADMLMKKGKIKRTTGLQPFLYLKL